jgi:hypothetical protein
MPARNSRAGSECHKPGRILRDNTHTKNDVKIILAIKGIRLNINTDKNKKT